MRARVSVCVCGGDMYVYERKRMAKPIQLLLLCGGPHNCMYSGSGIGFRISGTLLLSAGCIFLMLSLDQISPSKKLAVSQNLLRKVTESEFLCTCKSKYEI